MTKVTHNLTYTSVKNHIPAVQSAIKKVLKVDAGKQAAYHIFSVCQFLKDDHVLKALCKKDHYTLITNLGTKASPCIVEHELGVFDFEHQAKYEAECFVRACQQKQAWTILKNGEPLFVNAGTGSAYEYTLYSKPTPEKGLVVSVQLRAECLNDIENMLEEVTEKVSEGITEDQYQINNEEYEFDVYGEEYDVIHDIDCLVDDNLYAVFDDNGIIFSDDNEAEILGIWEDKEDEITDYDGSLILGEFVELHNALDDDSYTYHAISRKSGANYSGEIMDILDSIKDEKDEFSLYREVNRVD